MDTADPPRLVLHHIDSDRSGRIRVAKVYTTGPFNVRPVFRPFFSHHHHHHHHHHHLNRSKHPLLSLERALTCLLQRSRDVAS